MFSFIRVINNSITVQLRFLLLRISAIILSKTINILRFFIWVFFFNVFINIIHIIRVFKKKLQNY